jgi:hypothetical protein
MDELEPFLTFLVLGTVVIVLVVRGYPARERTWLLASWALHVGAAFFQATVYLYHYEGGDLVMYSQNGVQIAALLRQGFSTFFPEVMALLFQGDARLPFAIAGVGNPTGTMSAFTGLICFFVGGSVYTCCLVFAWFSFFGKLWMFSVLSELPGGWKAVQRALVATMFLPSVLVWSCAPLKESVAITGLGLAMVGMERGFIGKRRASFVLVLLGGYLVALAKPYLLFAAAIAFGAFVYVETSSGSRGVEQLVKKPLSLILGVMAGFGLVVLLGGIFSEFSLEKVAESAAIQQEASSYQVGGSNYEFGNPQDRSLAGQLALAPLALLASWFRPFIFESKNFLMVANSLETTFVLGLFLLAIRRSPPRRLFSTILGNRWLTFAFVFSLVFGVGVGLGTTNLGTLSRYRMPLQPFLVLLVMVLARGEGGETELVQAPRVASRRAMGASM